MTPEAVYFWNKCILTLRTASHVVDEDPDSSISRAYYAAFYTVTALFALESRTFSKHREIIAAVHRDLVRTGRMPAEAGRAFSRLAELRNLTDYGAGSLVAQEEATRALEYARNVMAAVAVASHDALRLPKEGQS